MERAFPTFTHRCVLKVTMQADRTLISVVLTVYALVRALRALGPAPKHEFCHSIYLLIENVRYFFARQLRWYSVEFESSDSRAIAKCWRNTRKMLSVPSKR